MKALVTGVTGQDGAYLAKLLIESGFRVWGGARKHSGGSLWRLHKLDILSGIQLFNYENGKDGIISDLILEEDFDLLFHFAGSSYTVDSITNPQYTIETNTIGLVALLELVRKSRKKPAVFVAGSSEVFGNLILPKGLACDENTNVSPRNPYGISHSANMQIVEFYRDEYRLNINLGIFFNHESVLRSQQFLTRKLSMALSNMKKKKKINPIPVGNLDSIRDFGYAPYFMRGAYSLSQTHNSSNYIFNGGAIHNIREVLSIFANLAGFTPQFVGDGLQERCLDVDSGETLFYVSDAYYRKKDSHGNFGNSKRLEEVLGFNLYKPFVDIAREMLDFDFSESSYMS